MARFPRRFLIVLAVSLVAAAGVAGNALADAPTLGESCAATAKIGDARECTFTVANDASASQAETLAVSSLTDRVHAFDGDVAADLLPGLLITPTGGATCNVSGAAPGAGNTVCTLPFGASIAAAPTSIYTLRAGDFLAPGHLLTDDASLAWRGAASGPGVASAGASTLVEQITSTTTASIVSDTSGTEHPSVTVTGEPNRPVPVGDVAIDWFATRDCAGAPSQFGPALLKADGTFDAVGFSATSGGSFRAHYLGDPTEPIYAPSDSACVASTAPTDETGAPGGTPTPTGAVSPNDLIAVIASASLDSRLASDLTARAQTASDRLAAGRDACRPLDGLVRRVGDASRRGQLTGAQAQTLLDAASSVEARLGC